MTVEEMLDRMSALEFSEWMAYAEIEPISPLRADRQAAMICYVLAEINRDKKKTPRRFKVEDFMPKYGNRQPQKWETILMKAQTYTALTSKPED